MRVIVMYGSMCHLSVAILEAQVTWRLRRRQESVHCYQLGRSHQQHYARTQGFGDKSKKATQSSQNQKITSKKSWTWKAGPLGQLAEIIICRYFLAQIVSVAVQEHRLEVDVW